MSIRRIVAVCEFHNGKYLQCELFAPIDKPDIEADIGSLREALPMFLREECAFFIEDPDITVKVTQLFPPPADSPETTIEREGPEYTFDKTGGTMHRIARQGPSPLADPANAYADFMKVSDAMMAKQMMSFYLVPFDKADPPAEVVFVATDAPDDPIIATDPNGARE